MLWLSLGNSTNFKEGGAGGHLKEAAYLCPLV